MRSVTGALVCARATKGSQCLFVQPPAMLRKAAEYDAVDTRCRDYRFCRRMHRNPGGAIGRESVDAGGNRWKGNRSQAVGPAESDCGCVTRLQRLIFASVAAAPDRADGMNHMPRRKLVTLGDLGAAGLAAMEGAAFREQPGPRRAMNRAINAAPAEQRRIGSVDDGVNA